MTTPIAPQDVLAYLDLIERRDDFLNRVAFGDRLGQSFFNVLPHMDQRILAGTVVDPFHHDDWPSVCSALDYLLERN